MIAVVSTRTRDYAVTLLDDPLLEGVPTYHLKLTPLRKPKANRLRDLWVDASDYLPRQAVVAGNFTDAPLTDVPWTISFAIFEGAPVIASETADTTLYLPHRRVVRDASIAFENIHEPSGSLVGEPLVEPRVRTARFSSRRSNAVTGSHPERCVSYENAAVRADRLRSIRGAVRRHRLNVARRRYVAKPGQDLEPAVRQRHRRLPDDRTDLGWNRARVPANRALGLDRSRNRVRAVFPSSASRRSSRRRASTPIFREFLRAVIPTVRSDRGVRVDRAERIEGMARTRGARRPGSLCASGSCSARFSIFVSRQAWCRRGFRRTQMFWAISRRSRSGSRRSRCSTSISGASRDTPDDG